MLLWNKLTTDRQTDRQTDIQTDRQTDRGKSACFCVAYILQ